MIGVVIPAHNECERLGATLAAVWVAARHESLCGEPVGVIVVLDSCTDGSERIAEQHRVARLALDVRNVGIARARGAELCIEAGYGFLPAIGPVPVPPTKSPTPDVSRNRYSTCSLNSTSQNR